MFTPVKKSHMAKLEDLLKVLLKNELKTSPKGVSILEKSYKIWGILYLLRIGVCVSNHYEVG